MPDSAEPVWCFICEDAPAKGALLRYRDGRPVPREEGAVEMAVCAACGKRTSEGGNGFRYIPFLRPRDVAAKSRRSKR